jgi:hypothetical protein
MGFQAAAASWSMALSTGCWYRMLPRLRRQARDHQRGSDDLVMIWAVTRTGSRSSSKPSAGRGRPGARAHALRATHHVVAIGGLGMNDTVR